MRPRYRNGFAAKLCIGCLAVLVPCFAAAEVPNSQSQPADFWLRNGTIYTLRSPGSTVESLVVRGERIVFAGAEIDARTFVDDRTKIIDLHGRTVLPGFTDSHVHPVSGGLGLAECDLTGIEDAEAIVGKLADFAQAHPDKPWVRGNNFVLAAFPNGSPHKSLLDEIIPDRPVFVESTDGHNAWVNSSALRWAKITAATPNPKNGRIERGPDGEPSGTLREEAMSLVQKVLPAYTHAERVEALRRAVKLANSLGITTLVEASATEDLIRAYLALAETRELSAHVNIAVVGNIADGAECVQYVRRLNQTFGRGRSPLDDVAFGQAKLFMDGVVEGKTAALLQPYVGESHNGIANADAATANEVITDLDRAGLQIHIHAIGDRAVRMALDGIEHARKVNGVRDSRHHIAHLQVVHPDDIPRFAALDVTANFQALWATLEDSYMTKLTLPVLGPKRSEWQYPIGTIARSGGRLAFGSDWSVTTMNPFHAAQVAVNRRGPDRTPREPWTPQHLIDLYSVIEGYTKGGAWLTFREADAGTLEVGKLADLVIVDRDVFETPPFELFETKVELTMFRGRIVFDHDAS